MQPTADLMDAIFHERVLRARRMPPEEKLLSGPRLFDYACRITLQGIRQQFPDMDELRAREVLSKRLALRRKLEEAR